MLGSLDNLDGRMVADIHRDVRWQRDLRQTDGARVGVIRRADDLERLDHGMAHVRGHGSEADVDVDEGLFVAWEPARLE